MELPITGLSRTAIEQHLSSIRGEDIKWRDGLSTKSAFYVTEDLLDVATRAYGMYLSENALFTHGFKSLARLERDVIGIALGLLGGSSASCGTFTSGGSESNFVAVYAAREHARRAKRLTAQSTIVAPESVHVTINKAAHLLGLRVIRTPLSADRRGDADALAQAIDDNTIMVVGSAPCWPFGVVDPIPEFARAAQSVGAWTHVDACVGAFSLPFVRRLGHPIPPFDLSVPGVHSVSGDIHKYGFAPKGASVLLFASQELRECSNFEFEQWPSGYYKTYTFQGSRSGGPLAAAWATLNYLGEAGYVAIAREVMATKHKLEAGLLATGKLGLLNATDAFLTAYVSTDSAVEIHLIGDCLEDKGWSVSRLRTPAAIHLPLNPIHSKTVDLYLAHVRAALELAGRGGRVARTVRDGYSGDPDLQTKRNAEEKRG